MTDATAADETVAAPTRTFAARLRSLGGALAGRSRAVPLASTGAASAMDGWDATDVASAVDAAEAARGADAVGMAAARERELVRARLHAQVDRARYQRIV